MTNEEKIAQLEAEKKALQDKLNKQSQLRLKISEKGALSLYGMGRFPVTLYKEQWRRVFAFREEIEAFIVKNDHLLKAKGEEIPSQSTTVAPVSSNGKTYKKAAGF